MEMGSVYVRIDDVSSNSSSISSSTQSPPDHHNTASASSPDQQIYTHGLVPAGSSAQPRPSPTTEQAMRSLKESIPHYEKWQRLKNSDRGFQKDASAHKKAVRRLSKELYMIVSLYALLQGALFGAVAQTSTFACEDWWGPVGIAVMVTLGTLFGAHDKLVRMGQEKQEAKKSHTRQSAVYDKIAKLESEGSSCDIRDLDPEHSDNFDPEPIFSIKGLLVLCFLAGFSALIITSCVLMLCHSCHCAHG